MAGSILNFFIKGGNTIAAILSLVLLISIFVFYGLRWFEDKKLKGSVPTGIVPWPPIVNSCPDFMVTYNDTANKKVYCYDAGNFYGLKSGNVGTNSGIIRNITVNGVDGQIGFLLNDNADGVTGDNKLPLIKSFINNNYTEITDFGTNAGKYFRWEGIWDGINNTSTQLINTAAEALKQQG